jgi:hypothetical protein
MSVVGHMATRNTQIFIFAGSARPLGLPTANFTRSEVSRLLPRAVTDRTFRGGEKRREIMRSTVDVFFIQEGREPNPSGKAYLAVPIAEAVALLGLSDKLEYHPLEMPPRFGSPSPIDGIRSARYVVAKINKLEAKTLGLREGFYVLEKTVAEIAELKSGEKL